MKRVRKIVFITESIYDQKHNLISNVKRPDSFKPRTIGSIFMERFRSMKVVNSVRDPNTGNVLTVVEN